MGAGGSILDAAPNQGPELLCSYDLPEGTNYWTADGTKEGIIQYAKKGRASKEVTPGMIVHDAFKRAADRIPNKVALAYEPKERTKLVDGKPPGPIPLEEWKKWTYKEYYNDSRALGKAMIKLGLEQFDSCSVYGVNSPFWFISQWAVQFAGGRVAGIYPSDTPPQAQYKANHANASIVSVDDEKEFKTFKSIIDDLPYVKAIITWNYDNKGDITRSDGSVVRVLTWDEAIAMGKAEPEDAMDARIKAQKPGHCCAIIYTSGTTGNPKAVMISHDNLAFNVNCTAFEGLGYIGASESEERIISYLPLSHVAGMLVDIASPVFFSAFKKCWFQVYFARPYDLKIGTLGVRLKAVKPTMFLGVPRVWEKIAEKMKAVGAATTGVKKKLATWAKAKGLEYQKNCQVGGNGAKPSFYGLAEKIVLKKVKAAIGLDECKFAFTGAAPMPVDVQVYFASLGININEAYGMSECTGATTWSTDFCHQWGSVGYALEGQEVKVLKVDGSGQHIECPRAKDVNHPTEEEQGELCYRGRHIMMGYMANPRLGDAHVAEVEKKNREAIDSKGWLHSGDKGTMSAKGMVRVTGRYKELIIGAGGENIAPVPIEDEIKKICPAISNIQMIGDKRKFNVCLVTLKAIGATGEFPGGDDLDQPAINLCSPGVKKISEAFNDATIIKVITDAITKVNKNGDVCPSTASMIQKFTILPRDFSVETGELTATLKLKRSVVEEMHVKMIDSMYESNDTYVKYQKF